MSLIAFAISGKNELLDRIEGTVDAIQTRIADILLQIVDNTADNIRERVSKHGKDMYDQSFVGYSPKYAAWKAKQVLNFDADTVDLTLTGNLLGNLQTSIAAPNMTVVTPSESTIDYGYALQNNSPKREWFGLTPAEQDIAGELFNSKFGNLLDGIK